MTTIALTVGVLLVAVAAMAAAVAVRTRRRPGPDGTGGGQSHGRLRPHESSDDHAARSGRIGDGHF